MSKVEKALIGTFLLAGSVHYVIEIWRSVIWFKFWWTL